MRENEAGLKEKLVEATKKLDLSLDSEQLQRLIDYLKLMQKWNAVYNLTAISEINALLTHHVLDSLAIYPYINSQCYLDVGTGAGLPGIPLAILFPDKQFTLLDSNSKKTGFLLEVVRQLGLKNVTVLHTRIESSKLEGHFDGVISRAFSSLDDFINLAGTQLKKSGVLLAMKGPKVAEELKDFTGEYTLHPITVPFLDEVRFLCIVKGV